MASVTFSYGEKRKMHLNRFGVSIQNFQHYHKLILELIFVASSDSCKVGRLKIIYADTMYLYIFEDATNSQ